MTPKKYQIFVSSTYSDLADIRRGVIDSIQRMNHFAVGMEQFSADDDEQWEIIQETIQQTDYYICLIGHRYGSIGPDGLSYTEMEWDYAKALGIPIMSFVRERNTATTPEQRDLDPTLSRKLDEFITKATAAKMVDFWTDSKDLNLKIVTALHKAFARKPRPGWIRSESERVSEEMAKLIEDNRALSNQLDKMTAEATGERPSFQVTFNGDNELKLETLPKPELDLITPPKLEPIEWVSISPDLQKFTSQDEITNYNSALPSTHELAEICGKINSVRIAKQTVNPLTIIIANVGSAKAREVTIEITFPDTVLVMEKDEFEQLSEPTFNVPVNPLFAAQKKLDESRRPKSTLDVLAAFRENQDFTKLFSPNFRHDTLMRHINFDKGSSVHLENNKVTIWFQDLMHTRQRKVDELVIIPIKSGTTGEITLSIICEEIPAPHEESIPLKVIEKSQASPTASHA